MFRAREGFEQRSKTACFLLPNLGGGDFAFARCGVGVFANVIADENSFQGRGRLRALVRADFGVERGDDFLRNTSFVVDI